MNLTQSREISRLSSAKNDGCTFAPDWGYEQDCDLHDTTLKHFVFFTVPLNDSQIAYMLAQGLYGYVTWAASKGRYGTPVTWKMANHLFRESLSEHIDNSKRLYEKAWYWVRRGIYYFGVSLWRKVKRGR